MSEYGIAPSIEGVLPWSWALERLAASRNFWLSTTSPGGAPHSAAVWAIWLREGLYFDTGSDSRKARNLAADPRVVVTTERADEAVILHGRAQPLDAGAFTATADQRYAAKYGEAPPGQRYLVRPTYALGFIEEAAQFGHTATRWDFP